MLSFRVEANTSVGLIRRLEHRSVMFSSYKNCMLVSADIKTWVGQELESSCVLYWDGNQYVKQAGKDLSDICREMVSYSSTCVYFEQPLGRTSLFYEKYGRYLDVQELGNHRYEIELPNESVERYSYKNGKVIPVEIVQSFATTTVLAVS